MKLKNVLLTGLSFVLVAAVSIGGTLAYLTSEDSDVNVMTLGNVSIEQHEYERVVNADGTYATAIIDNQTSYILEEFKQAKPLLPIVGDPSLPGDNPEYAGYDNTVIRMSQVDSYGSAWVFAGKNAQDKLVTIENTGKSDAYIRTLIAYECGSINSVSDFNKLVSTSEFKTNPGEVWTKSTVGIVNINGNNYVVIEFIYNGGKHLGGVHENGILPAGETSYPSLCQVYMKSSVTNEDCEALDGNANGTYDILVLTQAVQAAGFANADEALNESFGAVSAANAANWFGGVEIPRVTVHDDVLYFTEGNVGTISSQGGNTAWRGVYSDGKSNVTEVVINEGITRLNNRALCKMPNLTTVSLPESLTYIDEGAFQQSGFVTIEVPENVTYIGKTAFGACPNLETIIIKSKNVTFANYVGRDSGALKEVYIYSDTVTFESGAMYFTNKQTGEASDITFYVANQDVADALYNSSSATRSYGMLIKSIDGTTTYYNTLK
jgi:predicted ribosomally synthesized peptide with SipW-like signal peptide